MKTGKLCLVIVSLVWSLLLFPGLSNAQPWLYNGSDIYYDQGKVGIGTSVPTAMFEVGKTTTSDVTMAVTGTSTATQGMNWTQTFAKAGGNINVFRFRPGIAPTGSMSNAYIVTASPRLQSANSIDAVNAFNVTPGADSGAGNTVTDLRYYYCGPFDDDASGGATITNMYGLYVSDLTYADNSYAVYTLGGRAVFNENGGDNDFRVEGDTNADLLFVDASTDRIGIGISNPGTELDVNGVISATGGDSSEWNAAHGWGDHSLEGYLKVYTETDPVFTAWDKSTGISITEGQISDLDHFTTGDETDPAFTGWNKSDGISITESQISDLDHFTNADETDPVYSASPAAGIASSNITNWDIAYIWGDHASIGYDASNDSWAGTENVYMTSGNAGIGTTSPSAKLEINVSGGSSSNDVLGIKAVTSAYDMGTNNIALWGEAVSTLTSEDDNESSYGVYATATHGASPFGTAIGLYASAAGAEDNYAAIFENGNVGVGTISPNSALQVTGYVQLDTVSAAPPATDCDEASEAGRMKFDDTSDVLYVCSGASGWVTK